YTLAVCFIFILSPACLFAQIKTSLEDSLKNQRDASSILNELFGGKKELIQPDTTKKEKNFFWAILPSAAYNPSVGFAVGATSAAGKYFGDRHNTILSVMNAGAYISTNGLSTLEIKHNAFTSKNIWNLQGTLQVGKTIAKDNGLGTGRRSIGDGPFHMDGQRFDDNPDEFPIRYTYLKVNERIYRKVTDHIYIGAGLSFNFYGNIDDDRKNIPVTQTHNFRYSLRKGYSPYHYNANGILLNFQYNSRDQPNRAFKGIYADVVLRANQGWLGSNHNAVQVKTEFRKYWSLSQTHPEHVFAFWHWANYLLGGSLPYLELPGTACDAYGRIGRGFIIGRFKGPSFVYNEAEYRFPITSNKLLSGVTFVNIESANNQRDIKLFRHWEPGAGIGLRLLFNKFTRSNMCFDYARGSYGASGFFLGLNEVF
ncbi:MAG TPA: BamA/TamA family outer membrane protein, partial [Mucilaginibacter sp.]